MAATGGAAKGPQRKKRVQGPWMDSVEQLALLRTGIAVSISSMVHGDDGGCAGEEHG